MQIVNPLSMIQLEGVIVVRSEIVRKYCALLYGWQNINMPEQLKTNSAEHLVPPPRLVPGRRDLKDKL
ncbi:MAG: hypothetical protein GY799_02815 [Desulfobulbaceae bacterium]|nr:hypothetical protein [Desulfobulbaceae bacterium]